MRVLHAGPVCNQPSSFEQSRWAPPESARVSPRVTGKQTRPISRTSAGLPYPALRRPHARAWRPEDTVTSVKDTSQPPVTVLDGGKTRLYDVIQLVEFYQLNAGVLPTSAGNEAAFWSRRFILQVKDTSQPPVTVLDGGKTRLYDVIQLVEFYQLNARVLPTSAGNETAFWSRRFILQDTSQPPVTVLDGGKTRLYDVIQLVEFYQLNAGVLPSAHPSHLLHHAHRAVVVIGAPSRRAELLTAAAPPPAPPAAEARGCSS
ncbi:uncharacterized protein LOC122373188 [Amphibalanus amphitrite]|uniref:uncharacterized protein LOC122373188 n=1 Tax=Amphibalanus amphitrite TaxID=1232801 RepID=UPI001C91F39D|nr:uncharacterized protein LOC122373188 [Amphibalanus amphitrite]